MQNITERFEALRASASALALGNARSRAEKIRQMITAVLANKQRFYDAAHTELQLELSGPWAPYSFTNLEET